MSASSGNIDLTTIGLLPNPNGDPPNFDGGPNLKATVLATGLVFGIISATVVVLRLITSIKTSGRLYIDDYLCLFGEIFGIAEWGVNYAIAHSEYAKHSWDVPASRIGPYVMKIHVADLVLSILGFWFVKSAILAFFLRVFGTLRWVSIACYSLLTLLCITYGACLITNLALCVPLGDEGWGTELFARCATVVPAPIAFSSCTVLIDIVMFAMPFPIIARLHLSRHKKRGLMAVFLVGFLIVVTSIVSLAYRIIVGYGPPDPLWNGTNVAITAYTEVFGTAMISCAPALSAFWATIFTKTAFYSSLRSSYSRSKQGSSKNIESAPCPDCKQPQTSSSTRDLVHQRIPMGCIHKATHSAQETSEASSEINRPVDFFKTSSESIA